MNHIAVTRTSLEVLNLHIKNPVLALERRVAMEREDDVLTVKLKVKLL